MSLSSTINTSMMEQPLTANDTVLAKKVVIEFKFKNFEAISSKKFEKVPKFDPEWEEYGILTRSQYNKIVGGHKRMDRGPQIGKSLKPLVSPFVLIPLGVLTPFLKVASYFRTEENVTELKEMLADIGLNPNQFSVKQHMDYCRIPIGYTIRIEGFKLIAPTPAASLVSSSSDGLNDDESKQVVTKVDLGDASMVKMISATTLLVMMCTTSATWFMMNAVGA